MTPLPVETPLKPRLLAWPLGLYVALFTAFALAAMQAPESGALALIFISVLIGATVAIFGVWCFSDRSPDLHSLRNLIFTGMVIDVIFNWSAKKLQIAELLSAALTGVGNLGVLAAAVGVGLVVGRGLKRPNYLIMAAIVGALTDIISVYAGPSKHVNGSAFFDFVSFQWGVIGMGGVQPAIGAGDFIFLTLYFFGARRFGLDDRKTLGAMILAIAVGFVVTLFLGSVPALPFMSVALLLTHGRELKRQMKVESELGSRDGI